MSGFSEWAILLLGILYFSRSDAGQTVDPLKKPEINSLHIYSDIKYRFATTTVTSRVKNVDTQSREAIFDVTLPNEAFITNLTLEIDGKIIVGDIKEKEVARKQYVAAQQRGESAGYIGTRQRETNRFNLAVTVAPQSKVSFNLTYQELLKRKHGHYEQVIYIDPGQPVPDMDITVAILESREITDLRVPPLRNDVNADLEDVSTITVITTPTPKTAHVKFVPSIEHQTAQSASGMAGQFVVQYDVEREMDAGDVLVVNGYFVHFFAPEGFQSIPNDVLFILDTSGSMTGTKMSQLKDAMTSIIGQLTEGDRMNMMTFSGSTSFWKTEMVNIMDEDTMEEAKTHISSLKAGGWTNIELALTTGIAFMTDRTHNDGAVRSPVIVFLTDGEATQGVTNKEQILKNVHITNEGDIPIFSLAFGEHADYDIVKKISIQNNGLGRKIYEASDAAMQIAGFYNEIAVTLLNNVTFQYLDAPVANVTQHAYANYFNGSEMVISGRVQLFDDVINDSIMTLKIISNSVDGPDMVLSGDLSNNIIDLNMADNMTNTGDFEKITEKVWAYLTIKQFLDKELAASNPEEKKAYNRQILELSLKYGFVTPLTSMVVTLPNEDETGKEEKQELIDSDDEKTIGRQMAGQSRPNIPPRLPFSGQKMWFMPPTSLGGRGRLHSRPYASSGAMYDPPPMPSSSQYKGYADADIDDDDMDAYSAPSVSKFGGRRGKSKRKQKKQQRKDKRKNRRKNRRKMAGFRFPLRVQFPNMVDPLCFNMYESSLETAPGSYVLYADTNKDLRVEVKLEKTVVGKWTKQGSTREIHLISGVHHEILTNETFSSKNISTGDLLPWEVTVLPAADGVQTTTGLTVKLDAFDMLVTLTDDGYLNIVAERSTQHGPLTGDGIIREILSKKIQVIKIRTKPAKMNKKNKRRSAKEIALLKMDGEKFMVMKRVLGPAGTGAEKCWDLQKKETKVVAMATMKV